MNYTLLKCKSGLKARLQLADGTRVEGCGFGAREVRVGEVVFTTSMPGYPEALTDPSYAGQILIWTHPMVGCYGIPSLEHSYCGVPLNYESDRVHVEGFIVSELPPYNHYLSLMSLAEWLESNNVPVMYRVDTRALVKRIREYGVLMGVLAVYPESDGISWGELEARLNSSEAYDARDYTLKVSPRTPVVHRPYVEPRARIAVLDCGMKYGVLRELLKRGFEVTRFPCWSKASELLDFDGVVLSNGPGNPAVLKNQISTVREIVYSGKPVLGICLGMQLISLALGARAFKLRYGHRGANKGVVDVVSGRSYITTQNHGYAIDEGSLEGTGLRAWFKNIDDGTLEGVRHERLPVLAVQFHPEGGPGPLDTTWVFELFARKVSRVGDG